MNIKKMFDTSDIQYAPTKYKLIYMVFVGVPIFIALTQIQGGMIGAALAGGIGSAIGIILFKLFIKIPKQIESDKEKKS